MIIIVARNGLALTKAAIKSAMAQDENAGVLLVDNCSDDGTGAWARTKGMSLISPPKQYSLARCWNTALDYAWRIGEDSALVINNDVELRPDTLRLLREHGGEFVSGVSVDTRERMKGERTAEMLRASESLHPDFSCFLIRKSVTDRVGWFDENYFPAYFEDNDYHVRMHRAGVRAVAVDLPFFHHSCGTIKNSTEVEREQVKRGVAENRERFRRAYGCLPSSLEYDALFA